jgi:hypothetical protein
MQQETQRSHERACHIAHDRRTTALTAVALFLLIFSAGTYLWSLLLPQPPQNFRGATDGVFFAGWNLTLAETHELDGVSVSAMSPSEFWSTLIAENAHKSLPPVKVIPQTRNGEDCMKIKAIFAFLTPKGVMRTTETRPFIRPGLRAFEHYGRCSVTTEGFVFDVRADTAAYRQYMLRSAASIFAVCTILYATTLLIVVTILADLRRFARRVEESRLRDALRSMPAPASIPGVHGYDPTPPMHARARAS